MESKTIPFKALTGQKGGLKKALSLSFFVLAGLSAYAQVEIPGEVQTSLESIRDVMTGDLARVLIGIFFVGSCFTYAYNKDNDKMKGKVIAVMIASGLIAISQGVVDSALSMGH